MANPNALQGSTLDYNNYGGTLSFGTVTSETFGGLQGSQSLALTNNSGAAVALSVGANGQSTTYSGVLSGAGSLNKTGTGTWTLSNYGTFTGNTSVSGGVLAIGNSGIGIQRARLQQLRRHIERCR